MSLHSSADRPTRLDLRLAACSLGASATAVSALAAGRVEVAHPVLGGALLLLAGAGLAATRRDRRPVAVVAPVADVGAITAGHRGVSGRRLRAIEAA